MEEKHKEKSQGNLTWAKDMNNQFIKNKNVKMALGIVIYLHL